MRRTISLALIFAWIGQTGCSPDVSTAHEGAIAVSGQFGLDQEAAALHSQLEGVQARASKSDTSSGDWPFFDDAVLRSLYPRSLQNLEAVKTLIVAENLDADLQILAVRIEQCLPLSKYVEFLGFAAQQFMSRRIRPETMESVIAPGAEWGVVLAMNYENAEVVKILSNLRDSPLASNRLKGVIRSVLSGEQAEFVRAQRDAGQSLPILSCNS